MFYISFVQFIQAGEVGPTTLPDLCHCPSNGNEASQSVDEGVCCQIFQYLEMHAV